MSDDPAASLGKKFLGLFVEIDETAEAPAQASPAPKAAAAAGVAATAPKPQSVDQDMLATLQKKISSRSTAYVTLIEAAQRLVSVIPDEPIRLKAAFAMVSGEGNRSVASITQAIDVHIADLEGERIRFKNASDAQTNVKSAALRKQADTLTAQSEGSTGQIERLQAEIAKLQEAIANNTAQCRDLIAQADQADAEIKSVSAAFDRTVDFLKTDLAAKKVSLSAILA